MAGNVDAANEVSDASVPCESRSMAVTDTPAKASRARPSTQAPPRALALRPATRPSTASNGKSGLLIRGISRQMPSTNSTSPRAASGHQSRPDSHKAQAKVAATSTANTHNARGLRAISKIPVSKKAAPAIR